MNYLILVTVLMPAAAGCILPLVKKINEGYISRCVYVAAAALASLVLVLACILQGEMSLMLWEITPGLPIYFSLDKLGMLFALVTSFMWLMSGIFAFEYMKHEGLETRYFSFYLISLTALLGVCFAGNLVTAYAFYEFMSVFTMPLVLHSLSRESVEAAKKYLFYSMGGAFAGLFAFFVLYNYAGAMTFVPGGCLAPEAISGSSALIYAASVVFIVGFGSKAGLWPLHGWLPTAHPVAPAPASALLSGNITKMGVLMIIRYIYYVVGADNLRGTYVQYVFLILSLLTILMGSMMAYKEDIFKKRLAYSTVSQVSYVLFGVACMNPVGMIGALMHVVFHSLVKNTLFLNAGAIIYKTGKTRVSQLVGIGKQMPVTMWCFTLVSLTLVGIPPTSAFVSKWYLAMGSLGTDIRVIDVLGPIVLLASALLTAGYLITITMRGFFPGEDIKPEDLENKEPNALMIFPMVMMTFLSVALGIFPGILTGFIEQIISAIM